MRHTFLILLSFLLAAAGASLAFAHGSSFSYEEIKEGYKIDIGHDEFIAADESVRFDFNVVPENSNGSTEEVFNDVWVTITKDKKLFFAGGISKPVFGAPGFTFVFPEEGTYELSARFQKDGEQVVKTEFPLEIIPPLQTEDRVNPIIIYALFALSGLIIGAAIMLFIPRKNKQA